MDFSSDRFAVMANDNKGLSEVLIVISIFSHQPLNCIT